jgi:magnesium-transporting ATPase (P-type)
MQKSVSCVCILALIFSCLPVILIASATDNTQTLADSPQDNAAHEVLGLSLTDFVGVTIVVIAVIIIFGIILFHKQPN